MNREEHITFIRSRLIDIMKEVACSANHMGIGMEYDVVNRYLLQSLFLQMTGAQEQKMKCICWELATNDLAYRQRRYYNGWNLNQCSTLQDKSHVYEDLLSAIHSVEPSFKLFSNDAAKTSFVMDNFSVVKHVFVNTNIADSQKRKFEQFIDFFVSITPINITPSDKHIFKNGDKDFPISKANSDTEMFAVYSLLYRYRNRCAHNTQSYQLNLPLLQDLRDEKYQRFDNIFIFFTTLVMIDEIFRRLFEKYKTLALSY